MHHPRRRPHVCRRLARIAAFAAAALALAVAFDEQGLWALGGGLLGGLLAAWQQTRQRRLLLDQAGIVEVEIDAAGTVRRWSAAGERMLGYSAAAVLGRNVAVLMPEPTATEHDGYLQRYVRGAAGVASSRILGTTRQVVGRHRDGHAVPLVLFVRPRRRHGQLVFEGLLQAVPERGGQRDQPMADELTPQLQWRWLRNLGHEIRTPMASIECHAEILTDPASAAAEREESAGAILRNSRHLHELLNDLLDHARLSVGEMPVHSVGFDLPELLRDVVAMMRSLADRKAIRLELAADPALPARCHTDPLRLRQILWNLLGNAIKFTPHGWVRLEASRVATAQGPRLRFDVCDTGAGIGGEFAPLLFQPFQQEARVQAGAAGSGLGLSICRRMARLLGGELTLVDSVPGVGSRFRVEVPAHEVASPDAGPEAPAPVAPSALRQTTILLVEDADDLRLAFRRFLEAAGATVHAFGEPHAALAALAAADTGYDLGVLDLMLPGMDGFALAMALRQQGFAAPLVALSADTGPEVEARCRQAGFARRLGKPIRRAVLVRELVDVLVGPGTPPGDAATRPAPGADALPRAAPHGEPARSAIRYRT
ncbi:MAG: response regulator [Planctomycetes bacterium]|nr:response regulator [Planctomycetota bacterium]